MLNGTLSASEVTYRPPGRARQLALLTLNGTVQTDARQTRVSICDGSMCCGPAGCSGDRGPPLYRQCLARPPPPRRAGTVLGRRGVETRALCAADLKDHMFARHLVIECSVLQGDHRVLRVHFSGRTHTMVFRTTSGSFSNLYLQSYFGQATVM